MLASTLDRTELVRLQRIAMDFPIRPVLERYCREYGVSKDAARVHERELKLYFVLTALHPDRPYGMKGPLDNLWHTFLWFTETYHAFSDALLGGKGFLHHHPCTTEKGASYPITYDGFWYDYAEAFGEPPPKMVWPPPSGPRRGWDELRAEVRDFEHGSAAADARAVQGRTGFGLAMLVGYGWLWGGSNTMFWRDSGATGCGGGGNPDWSGPATVGVAAAAGDAVAAAAAHDHTRPPCEGFDRARGPAASWRHMRGTADRC